MKPFEKLSNHGGETWVAKSGRKAFSGKSNFPALAPPLQLVMSAPKRIPAKAAAQVLERKVFFALKKP